ncbi:NUDIX hydrolase [Paenibacillus sp. 7541]|uniref:NUDIX hydrolase n=1 Tax=Paenibacillus sp. 7541 TaxID=2026236 RepID=UPI000BA77FAA|nr:NUDIX hydrolase [Paenibacillus sp. 7541]PAK55482.1 NUDIX hydrolase [Paenibacillus sp. 7541]
MNRIVYDTEYYAVEEHDGKEIAVIDHMPESAAVVVIHEGCLLMVRQHREAVSASTWELPGGTIRHDEDKVTAVQRELAEETGVLCNELTYMGEAYPAASLTNRKVHFYYTDDIKRAAEPEPDDGEDVAAIWVPLREACHTIKEGGQVDQMVGHGLFLSMLHGLLLTDTSR